MPVKFHSEFNTGFNPNYLDFPGFDKNSVLHIFDVFSDNFLQNLFSAKGQPGVIISDHIVKHDGIKKYDLKFYGMPCWLIREKQQWTLEDFKGESLITERCCNFMINKKQANRYACAKLCDIFLQPEHFLYTFSGIARNFDCKHFLRDMDELGTKSPLSDKERAEFLSPVKSETRFIVNEQTKVEHIDVGNNIGRVWYGSNRRSWNTIKEIFQKTAVALITETADAFDDGVSENQTVFTEKTLFPMLALNFPIWVGGYCNAEMWQKMGFDIFEDVIDHSYQHYDTLIERCVYAVKNNLHILTNFNSAQSLRKKHYDRLLENRRLILSNTLENYRDNLIESANEEHKQYLQLVKDKFINTTTNMV